ncbi:MAG: hypothetical protein JSV55_05735 [Deltaproteobacteria bacterium]|nr:MAG: hypothetical protein JSV55_05735 [Deltaproteobacteria bacterium]
MFRKEIRGLIWAFFLISLGGLLLHVRIHPPANSLFNWIPAAFGAANAFVLPFLFNGRATAPWGYLITWVTVATGTVTMTYYSAANWSLPLTVKTVMLYSTLPDIIILWAKVFLAHKILRFHWPNGVHLERGRGCAE